MEEEKIKRLPWRPKEGLDTLPPGWQDFIIELYAKGAADVEIKAWLWEMRGRKFSNDLWTRWMKEEDEFREVIEMGRIIAEAFYNKIGRENLKNEKFSYVGWYMQMKNRFGWKDKHEVDHTTAGKELNQLPEQETTNKIHELLRKTGLAGPVNPEAEKSA